MSSRSEAFGRIGPVILFILLLGSSTLVFSGMEPLIGSPPPPPDIVRSVDRGVAILGRASRPYADVTFSESLKAFIPDKVALEQGPVLINAAPVRPVIIGQRHGWDYPSILSRATRDRLSWTTGVGGSEIVAFAADEAHFRAAMAKAGMELGAQDLHPTYPMLAALHSPVQGARAASEGWALPPGSGDSLILFGPYVDLQAGRYRVRLHVQLQGGAEACRKAGAAYRPALAVTSDGGKRLIQAKAPLQAAVVGDDPCSLLLESRFSVPEEGSAKVETPLYAATSLPMLVDAYTLEPAAAAARSR